MPDNRFEKLLMAVTRNGQLMPTHFRGWAANLDAFRFASNFCLGATFNLPGWLREVADALEEIYTETIAKYEGE